MPLFPSEKYITTSQAYLEDVCLENSRPHMINQIECKTGIQLNKQFLFYVVFPLTLGQKVNNLFTHPQNMIPCGGVLPKLFTELEKAISYYTELGIEMTMHEKHSRPNRIMYSFSACPAGLIPAFVRGDMREYSKNEISKQTIQDCLNKKAAHLVTEKPASSATSSKVTNLTRRPTSLPIPPLAKETETDETSLTP